MCNINIYLQSAMMRRRFSSTPEMARLISHKEDEFVLEGGQLASLLSDERTFLCVRPKLLQQFPSTFYGDFDHCS